MLIASLLVACVVDGTDDVDPDAPLDASFAEHLTEGYDAVSGGAHLEKHEDGTIGGHVTDLVLEGRDDEPSVELAELDLPAFGEGEQ